MSIFQWSLWNAMPANNGFELAAPSAAAQAERSAKGIVI
jgi:hypothetical protein